LTKRFIEEVYPQFKDGKEGIALVAFRKEERDDFGTHNVFIDPQEKEG